MDEIVVSVFGTGRAKAGEPAYVLGEQVGRALAEAGFTIANGGYGGTMQAAAKGAASVGGRVIGVTCSAFKNSVANEFVTREIVTGSLEERLRTLIGLRMEQAAGTLREAHILIAKPSETKQNRGGKARSIHHIAGTPLLDRGG